MVEWNGFENRRWATLIRGFESHILRQNRGYDMKNLWARLGVTMSLTDEEVERLIGEDQVIVSEREKILIKVISDGRFSLDGETYVPQEAVADFNEKYNASYEENDYELCW